jgi:hypothetical protein
MHKKAYRLPACSAVVGTAKVHGFPITARRAA